MFNSDTHRIVRELWPTGMPAKEIAVRIEEQTGIQATQHSVGVLRYNMKLSTRERVKLPTCPGIRPKKIPGGGHDWEDLLPIALQLKGEGYEYEEIADSLGVHHANLKRRLRAIL